MKKNLMLIAVAIVGLLAFTGCNQEGPGGDENATNPDNYNIQLTRQAEKYVEIENPEESCVEVRNSSLSDFNIVDIWSAPKNGNYTHSYPANNGDDYIDPSDERTFCSTRCDEDTWKIKIKDSRGAVIEKSYERQCGFKELLLVKTVQ